MALYASHPFDQNNNTSKSWIDFSSDLFSSDFHLLEWQANVSNAKNTER